MINNLFSHDPLKIESCYQDIEYTLTRHVAGNWRFRIWAPINRMGHGDTVQDCLNSVQRLVDWYHKDSPPQ